MATSIAAREALLASLSREVARLEAGRQPADDRPVSTGSAALDRLLPMGGLRRGTLVEYLTTSAGSGAATLSLAAAREACREGQPLVVLDRVSRARSANERDRSGYFYPPTAAAWGIDLLTMLVLRPTNEADALWAFDQALRCPGVGVVWAAWDRLDMRDFRRLQLAAECGGTLGLLIRPAYLRGQPTWADVQWEVRTMKDEGRSRKQAISSSALRPWKLLVELVRCRGACGGQKVVLKLDETAGVWREVSNDATYSLPLLAQLADSTPARRA